MDRMQKEALVASMKTSLQQAAVVIVTQQSGLTVAEVTELRRTMKGVNAEFKVLKNTLAQLAVKDTPLEGLISMLQGPTALAYSLDPIAAPKAVSDFANKNDKLKLVGGALDGKILSQSDIKLLASMPSLNELRAKIIGIICAPATKLATILQEPAARVARVLSAKAAN